MAKGQSFCLLAWVGKTLSSNKAGAVTIGKKVQPSTLWPGGCALSGAQKVATDCAAVGGPPASGCAVARNPDGWMLGAVAGGRGGGVLAAGASSRPGWAPNNQHARPHR